VNVATALAWMLALVFALPAGAAAHPLGNFTSNHLTRLEFTSDAIRARYVLDDAEIPAFTILRSLDAGGRPSHDALARWAAERAREAAAQLLLTVDGRGRSWDVGASSVALRPGAGGLPTLYLTADLRATLSAGPHRIAFHDTTLPGKIGWKDVVVAPATEPTHELRTYPDALLGSPRDRTAVTLDVAASGAVRVADADTGALAPAAPSVARMDGLSALLNRDLGSPLALALVLLVATALGALHALEPGHGKTLLAVSLVGARATPAQALILATALTLAHTLGVVALGIVCLAFARYVVPESIYPWISLGSGIVVALLGARALVRELERRRHHQHHHDHDHDHGDAHAHAIPGSAPLRFREALVAAAGGNVAPCPAALVVLLAAIASHRIGFGLTLIVAFGIGLAATLTLLGIAVVRGAAWLARRPSLDRFAGAAPLVTASAIVAIGAWTIGEGAVAQGLAATGLPVALAVACAIAALAAPAAIRHRYSSPLPAVPQGDGP
jgi:ABC-type nickel/cobalt efflux system permease component RcnA